MMQSDREVVVVTGASAGVGRAVAHAFARSGARVALLARGEEGLRRAAHEVEQLGGTALVIPTDVADAKAVDAAAELVEGTFGPIDIWINDAMATVFAEFADIHPDEYRRATEVTYLGAVHGTMSALHRMLPRDHGTVVQVGSALAYRAIPLQSAYCGAKFAIRGFTDSVRTELMHNKSQVWISMVQLPAVNTPQFSWCRTKLPDHPQPVPPIFQPEVPAETIWWAAHHRRREVYCGGSAAAVILANKLAPAIADRYLARTGYKSQQIAGLPVPDDRPNNLFDPVPTLAATHGMFDDRATTRSVQTWLTTHRGIAIGAVVGCLAAASGVWRIVRP
jgi:NADP-dependent 3-hydroxy acid dehydrogenase YdfG